MTHAVLIQYTISIENKRYNKITAFERAKQTKKSPGPNGAGANKTQGPM